MKAKEIQDLINFIANSGMAEVNIETDQFKISVKKNADAPAQVAAPAPESSSAPTPTPVPAQDATPSKEATAEKESNHLVIKSPMIGTFYRSSAPDKPSFVNVGDKVTAGQTVCIVEAMKLFNEIESEVSGTIVKVLVDNSSPVEYDQPLFLVDPS